jgi:hypothetical protein
MNLSRKINETVLDCLAQDRSGVITSATELVRMYLIEGGWSPLLGAATIPGEGNLICVVEGFLPVYLSDFTGTEDGRKIIKRRVQRAIALKAVAGSAVDLAELRRILEGKEAEASVGGPIAAKLEEVRALFTERLRDHIGRPIDLARFRELTRECQEVFHTLLPAAEIKVLGSDLDSLRVQITLPVALLPSEEET